MHEVTLEIADIASGPNSTSTTATAASVPCSHPRGRGGWKRVPAVLTHCCANSPFQVTQQIHLVWNNLAGFILKWMKLGKSGLFVEILK